MGVARQYCGRLGKVANCQAGMFLAYVSPLGRALVDKGLYLPESWTSDTDRCAAAGVPEESRELPVENQVGAGDAGRGPWSGGILKAGWVAGDDAFGMSPSFREGLAGSGDALRAGRSRRHHGLAARASLDQSGVSGDRASPPAQAVWAGSGAPWWSAVPNCWRRPGGRLRWRREARVPAATSSAPSGCGRPVSGSLAKSTGPSTAGNRDGSEPRYYLSNAPEDTSLETLAYVGGSRWRIETEFETEKSDVGLDEYETRSWVGWHHHMARCLLGGAFLLSLQQAWGERCPRSPGRRFTGWSGKCCPGNGSDRMSCCGGWSRPRNATNGPDAPTLSGAPPFARPQTSLLKPSL